MWRDSPFPKLLAVLVVVVAAIAAGFYFAPWVARRPLPFANANRLATALYPIPYSPPSGRTAFNFQAWKTNNRSFEAMAAFHWQNFYLDVASGDPERVQGSRVSQEFFEVLGARPAQGRAFQPDDVSGNRRLVVISDSFWRNRLGGAFNAVGSRLTMDGASYEVVGRMPADFWFLTRQVQFWVLLPSRPNYTVNAVGLLRAGVLPPQAEAEARNIEASFTQGRAWVRLRSIGSQANELLNATVATFLLCLGLAMLAGAVYVAPLLRSTGEPFRPRAMAAARVWSFLLVKCVIILLVLGSAWILLARRFAPVGLEIGWWFGRVLVLAWPLLLLACVLIAIAFLDQNLRCPHCLQRLRMPLETGSWGSLVVDRAGTEYICPYGHGKLFVPGTHLLSPGLYRWTSYPDALHQLFTDQPTK